MSLNNLDIRKAIQDARIKHYELAEALKIHPCTLSHWLEMDMSVERKEEILKVIQSIK